MASDPMDYIMDEHGIIMDESHGQPANTAPQCQYQPSQQSSNSNSLSFQPQDAHHYDPVHNTDTWHTTNQGLNPYPPLFPPHSASQLPDPIYRGWQGYGEPHRGSQGLDAPVYPQPSGYGGMPHSPWGEPRSYEPHPTSFAYTPGVYGENEAPSGPNAAARSSVTASIHSQGSPIRRYPTLGHLPDDFGPRRPRSREETLRNYNERVRQSREAAGLPPSTLHIPGSYDYLSARVHGPSHSRRHDNADWNSEDDEDPLAAPDSVYYQYTDPYTAGLIFNRGMDEERRIAAARGALAAAKRVPSKQFVASLEKLEPKDLKEADRTCIICYNEFGIQNPDGVVEQPIRLPKCKHVFGDKCIKKWFEDSDSCPYCRDKLPAEQVHRKHPPIDQLYHARSRNVHLALAAQAYGARPRAGLGRAADEPSYGSSRHSFSQSQEEYHYIMRGSGAPDAWSHSPPRARDSENRRRQARGRASLGRPTSVGSAHQARLVAPIPPNPTNAERPRLQSITPNTLDSNPTTGPRRSITPGSTRQHSTGFVPIAVTPLRNRLSEASSPSPSEEVSPPVAVGSGVAAGGHSPPGGLRTYRDYFNGPDPYHSYLNSNNLGHYPGRPPNSRADTEPHSGQAISSQSRSPNAEYQQRHGDSGLINSALNENRWSR